MYVLNAGRLKHKVEIMKYEDTVDEYNRNAQELVTHATIWAEIKPMRGFEFLDYYREKNKVQTKITCRYRDDITEKMVVKFNGKLHEITAIIDIEDQHTALEIMVQERVEEDKPIAAVQEEQEETDG
ncbi:phage head closure protein [Pseudobutyrivibrio ruminis]|uniref:Head-tail adaptor protein n=1 Tax=Pseudobutyrivibrio ruminis TaxID=46206 RepID=A0A2G3DY84_9FIRM|nr:phage head closure protein [Pseudobutyrivibrio ruminis]PHU36012.1 hypothetical protein CSX01_01905 [Pseudobutyrivibrio ruminis]